MQKSAQSGKLREGREPAGPMSFSWSKGEPSMSRTAYPSDLTDDQWVLIQPLNPPAKPGGRPRAVDMRAVVNGILYLARAGSSWRMLPHDLPPVGTLSDYYHQWRRAGVWRQIHDTLRGDVREAAGREREPSAAILDSQSVKTTEKGGRKEVMTLVSK